MTCKPLQQRGYGSHARDSDTVGITIFAYVALDFHVRLMTGYFVVVLVSFVMLLGMGNMSCVCSLPYSTFACPRRKTSTGVRKISALESR